MRRALLLVSLLLAACGGNGGSPENPPAPASSLAYRDGGVLIAPGGEGTPVELNGRLIIVMGVRVGVAIPRIQIVDYRDATVLADFLAPEGITLVCAIVEDGRLYVFGVTGFDMARGIAAKGNRVVMISTTDLADWTPPQTVYAMPPDRAAYNLSVARVPGGYVMGYDFGGPNLGYDPTWQIAFLESPDLLTWSAAPGHFARAPWSSANALRYCNGYYYLFYSTQDDRGSYYTGAARSADRVSWELATKAAIYPTEAYQHINTTDFDVAEVDGTVYAAFAVGDQSGNGAMATATYPGSFAQMAEELFQ